MFDVDDSDSVLTGVICICHIIQIIEGCHKGAKNMGSTNPTHAIEVESCITNYNIDDNLVDQGI